MKGTLLDRERRLNEIGMALSKERDLTRLLELILESARELTDADGATIYTVTSDQALKFEIVHSHTLKYHLGGLSEDSIPFANIPLKTPDGNLNDRYIVTYAVNHKNAVNIKDAYTEEGFDFENTKKFDQKTGYRTRSVLAVPIMNHEGDVIALLQLINPLQGGVFSDEDEQLAKSLASQAGVAFSNQLLIQSLRHLFESLTRIIVDAIDQMSPMTGKHATRVPEATMLIAEAVNSSGYAHLTQEELYELKVAALLHDCGKITTPSYILEKKNKLEAMTDTVALVDSRLTIEEKELEISKLKGEISQSDYDTAVAQLKQWRLVVHEANEKPVFDEKQQMLDAMHQRGILSDMQWKQLKVVKGNLTDDERLIMQNHVVMTIKMLTKLIYPKELKRVPEIAGQHHEHLDGKGYPNQLKAESLSLQSRILAMADVFEALSAPDRPYKTPYPLSKILNIMKSMSQEGHLDPKLFEVFVSQKVYLSYAQKFLAKEQIDMN